MKAFLEEYGFVILIAIVIILLIVMATPVGNSIKASILGLVDRFSNTATSKLDKADQGDFTATIRQSAKTGEPVVLDLNSDSTTDRYRYTITYVSGGKTYTTVETTTDAQNGTPVNIVAGTDTLDADKGGGTAETASGSIVKRPVDDGSTLYVTVRNTGTNEIVQSNSIKFHR